jgi:hypothetical protein
MNEMTGVPAMFGVRNVGLDRDAAKREFRGKLHRRVDIYRSRFPESSGGMIQCHTTHKDIMHGGGVDVPKAV